MKKNKWIFTVSFANVTDEDAAACGSKSPSSPVQSRPPIHWQIPSSWLPWVAGLIGSILAAIRKIFSD